MVAGLLTRSKRETNSWPNGHRKILVPRSSLISFSTLRSKRGSLKAAIPSAAYQQDSTAVPPTPCVSPPHNLENKTVQPEGDQKKNTRMTREREHYNKKLSKINY